MSPSSFYHPVPGLALATRGVGRASGVLKALFHTVDHWPTDLLHKPVVPVAVRGANILHVMQPELANQILTNDGTSFEKHWIYRKIAGGESGQNSMIAAKGQSGWDAKAALGPSVNRRSATRHVEMIRSVTERMARRLDPAKGEVDISALLAAITFEVIWRLMFAEKDMDLRLPAFVHEAIEGIYASRMANDHRRVADLLEETAEKSMAFAARCPHIASPAFVADGDNPLDQATLRDNIRLFLSAGHKTSAAAIGWTLWFLARSPVADKAVRHELGAIDPSEPGAFLDTPVTSAVLNEAMRLFPPAVITVRQARHEMQLLGHHVPEGTPVVVNFYAMHRHRQVWPDPDIFDHTRFLPPKVGDITPGSFRPFSAGAHVCLGKAFAELESIVILADLLRLFRFKTASEPKPVYSFTLHAWGGVTLIPDSIR